MSTTSLGILLLHAAILVIQLLLLRLFPTQKLALVGVYFVLMPVGFLFFMAPPPALVAALALAGVAWMVFTADRTARRGA